MPSQKNSTPPKKQKPTEETTSQVDPSCRKLIEQLKDSAPVLFNDVGQLVEEWVNSLLAKLNGDSFLPNEPKVFNDPVWGCIVLRPAEILLLDTPLLQRLRGVRQLGMAHQVYPGAGYDRLEHILGVVEGSQRILTALETSAQGLQSAEAALKISPDDVQAIRLAALLHDVGHGPFSHATEGLLTAQFADEITRAKSLLLEEFQDVQKIATGELLSVLIILSPSMLNILTHARFPVGFRKNLPIKIVASILGSATQFPFEYLGAIVSGPIDADKLDYMARDSHHAGLTLGLETTRLLSQLQIVTVTPENTTIKDLQEKARSKDEKRYFDLGISRAGVGAYEQMIIGRAILYDRIYYHHKIRAAEAMVRCLIWRSEKDNGQLFSLRQLMPSFSDDTFLCVLGGIVDGDRNKPVSEETCKLAKLILSRDLYCRAFSFAKRYLAGLDSLNETEKNDTVALLSREILKIADDPTYARKIEGDIAGYSKRIAAAIGGVYGAAIGITANDIIVDLPKPDRVSVRGQDILVRTGTQEVEIPNLYFDSEKWSQAYQSQKHCGFVFCPRDYVPAVNLAAKVVFAEKLGVIMNETADRLTKTNRTHKQDIFDELLKKNIVSFDVIQRLKHKETRLAQILPGDIRLPDNWTSDGRDVGRELAEKLKKARPRGFPATQHKTILNLIDGLSSFFEVMYEGGNLKNVKPGEEDKLQELLCNHLRSQKYNVDEAKNVGGGKIDLCFEGLLIIENKISQNATDNPLNTVEAAAWQARRYSIPTSNEVVATVIGYKPKSELGLKIGRESICISLLSDEKTIEIRLAIPVDYGNPSGVKVPRK